MDEFSQQQILALSELSTAANAKLEQAAQAAASHAFNLGCSVGMLPALILTGAAYFTTGRGGWVAAAVTLVLMLLALAAFANLVAYIARTNAIRRIYSEEIKPQVTTQLNNHNLTLTDFEQFACQTLPAETAIASYLASSKT